MDQDHTIADDIRTLRRLGYAQELARRMSGFSNYALSLSIICILAGCITSFHVGFNSVGGAAIGIGWPVGCLFSLIVALTMGQVASAFPTAGGLYHWASILGGRGWGWATAWFNLAGLITVLAAINVGTYQFIVHAFLPEDPGITVQILVVGAITFSQALFNHLGIRVTTLLTDFSGWWIMIVAAALTAALFGYASTFEPLRLVAFTNYSGLPEGADAVWPPMASLAWLFALGLLLPAYTVTGFDASAHASEETVGAARRVPQGIVRSVVVSGIAGWVMLVAIVLAIPNMDAAARQGDAAFYETMRSVLPSSLVGLLFGGIAIAQYLCGLATVTSASRMAFAFARDGGLPYFLRLVSPRFRTPARAIWAVAVTSVGFTVYTPVYTTITVVCVIFLYISYMLPTALGLITYGRSWTRMGPWDIGGWFRPLAVINVLGCMLLIVIGMQPPNDKAAWLTAGMAVALAAAWYGGMRQLFPGPPLGVMVAARDEAARTEALRLNASSYE
jgi:amino acid transporter